MPIAFVKSGTLVQEITADGRCLEHLQEVQPTEEDEKQQRLDNLPEYRQLRGMTSLAEQLVLNTAGEDEYEKKEEAKDVAEADAEDDEFRRMLDDEARTVRVQQRLTVKRDRDAFTEARREMNEALPKTTISAKRSKVEQRRPEILFRTKKNTHASDESPRTERTKADESPRTERRKADESPKTERTKADESPKTEKTNALAGLGYDSESEE